MKVGGLRQSQHFHAYVLLVASDGISLSYGDGAHGDSHSALISTAVLSYTLGLRHALDADHISVPAPSFPSKACFADRDDRPSML